MSKDWRDIIKFDERSVRGFPEEHKKIAELFDIIQSSPQWSRLFENIETKLKEAGLDKYHVSFSNYGASYSMGASMHINMQDYDTIEVAGKPVGRENVVVHELIHASDLKLPFISHHTGPDPYQTATPESPPPKEVYATTIASWFIKENFPDLPVREDYSQGTQHPTRDGFHEMAEASQLPYALVNNKELMDICRQEIKFMFGTVEPHDEKYCRNLPHQRSSPTHEH